jgi:hypothetical protein
MKRFTVLAVVLSAVLFSNYLSAAQEAQGSDAKLKEWQIAQKNLYLGAMDKIYFKVSNTGVRPDARNVLGNLKMCMVAALLREDGYEAVETKNKSCKNEVLFVVVTKADAEKYPFVSKFLDNKSEISFFKPGDVPVIVFKDIDEIQFPSAEDRDIQFLENTLYLWRLGHVVLKGKYHNIKEYCDAVGAAVKFEWRVLYDLGAKVVYKGIKPENFIPYQCRQR